MVKPSTKGCRKLLMKKIQGETRLGVTFTKRRNGIFKKANELISLCGIRLAIVIFSSVKSLSAQAMAIENQVEIEKRNVEEMEKAANHEGNILNRLSVDQVTTLPQARQMQAMAQELKDRIHSEAKRRLAILKNYAIQDNTNLDIPGPNYGTWEF